ncbi:MAG: cofactor-independent phosphoglycerate mutase [Candidatus Omnitrophica bacterium]|nr:cofactor-independent phosphoglycerate mutase [Candidatus Omnitrophota bacterium]
MKYVVLVGDGMADYPLEELGNRTPLDVARSPNMDFLVKNGKIGLASFVPPGMTPGSDVANLAIFGYNPKEYFSGRGPLEATNLGVKLGRDEIAFRCNFITQENGVLLDYSAGHITTKEAHVLIKVLNRYIKDDSVRFYPGVSYRHIMVIKGQLDDYLKIDCFPPHDIIGRKISQYLPKGKASKKINDIMKRSCDILKEQDINQVRVDLGENPANMVWLWGQGKKVEMPSFAEKYGIAGSVISAVDLIKGIGRAAGLIPITVPGATGYYDTDYAAKAEYAINSLKENSFVFVHVEAPDEAGHNGDMRAKITAIENFDRLIVGRFLEEFKDKENVRILVLPDHPTPLKLRTHTSDPVCFAIYGHGVAKDEFMWYTELEAKKSQFRFENGYELMDCFIKKEKI